jgi:hypothetical protein
MSPLIKIPEFRHQHFAHCESGVMSSLLKHKGLELSEPMVFGLSGALCFAYLPFLKFGNMPLVSYRMFPGHIIRKFPKQLRISYFRKTYRDPDRAMTELDDHVGRGQMVGLQTSAYYTTYFPPEMRFHFNAHNIIIIGKEGDEYLVSDPVFDHLERIKAADLKLARFAKGLSAPKGLAHFPLETPTGLNLEKMIRRSVKKTANMMLHAPLPWIGISGIHRLAKEVSRLTKKSDPRYTRLFLGNIVRMQEEIGTGGGGFRFMYASFLQEAYSHTGWPVLQEASERMTAAGDTWRDFALACARVVKKKEGASAPGAIAEQLRHCADTERQIYILLKRI